MNEPMVYGTTVASSSWYDVGNAPRKLAIFNFKPHSESRTWTWLRSVVSSTYFAAASSHGIATALDAAYAIANGGVRPYFLLR